MERTDCGCGTRVSNRPRPEGTLSESADFYHFHDLELISLALALKLLRAFEGRKGLRPSVRLAGYTDGEKGRSAIEAAILEKGLQEQIDFRGRMPHTEVPDWIRSGRVGLVMLQPIPKFMKNIPTKLFEYWACGRPVSQATYRRSGLFSPIEKTAFFSPPLSPQASQPQYSTLLNIQRPASKWAV